MKIKEKLQEIDLNPENSIIIGSSILNTLGLREAKDIDVVVTKEKYDELAQSDRFKKEIANEREILIDDLFEIGTSWANFGRFHDLISHSIIINGIRYNTIEFLLSVKKSWINNNEGRPKDIKDVKLIEDYLDKQTQKERELLKNGNGVTCPIAVIVKGGKILTGHRHYTPDKWRKISVWTIPGGRSDFGETIEQTLRREVAEEVNITELKILDFIGESPGAKEDDIVPMFYCTTDQESKLMEPEKFSEWKWITIDEYISNEAYSGFNPQARKMIIDYLQKLSR